MPNSGDVPSRKCFSGVVSRLLCSGSLPTHPSEQLIEKLGDQKPGKGGNIIKQVVGTPAAAAAAAASSSPGVVARLMGLESFPTTPIDRSLGAYFRSKSVNSIDFLSYFDPVKHGQHRRVRTSVSFRYPEEVNDDFTSIILHEKWAERRKNREKFEVCNRSGKSRENLQDSGPGNLASPKKDLRRKKMKERRPIVNSKEDMVRSKCVRRNKKKKILAHCNKKIHPQGIIPEEVGSSRNQLRSKSAKSQSPYPRSSYSENVSIRENAITAGKIERKLKIEESCYYKRMVEEICMLSEQDVKENWIDGSLFNFEEIIQQLEHEIVEVLLNHFVDELVLLFGSRNRTSI